MVGLSLDTADTLGQLNDAEGSDSEAEPVDEALATDANLLGFWLAVDCLLYTSPSPRDRTRSRMPSSA